MNVGSLFTGIGGFDLGLERAGHTIAWQCEGGGDPQGSKAERDQWAQGAWRRGVLAAHWPGVKCSADVRDVAGTECAGRPRPDESDAQDELREGLERPRSTEWPAARIDLLCGGFPCQDLSVAGRRAGLSGARSGLFYEFARVADAVLPPGGWLLVENVPGLLSSQGGRDFAVVLATLADLGFHDLAWRVLDSRHFGVAQRRRRVYILARRAPGHSACTVLLEPTSSSGDPTAGGEAGARAATPFAGGTEASFVGALNGTKERGGWRAGPDEAAVGQLVTARTLTAHERWDGDTETFVTGIAENQRGELVETDYAHQLTSGGGKPGQGYGAARTAEGVRRLTPVECERLQGFPDDWTAHGPDSRRYAALGDAVTVNVAEWIGRRLMEAA